MIIKLCADQFKTSTPPPPPPGHLAILVSLGGIDLRLTFKRPEHSVKETILSRKSEIYQAIHCQQNKSKFCFFPLKTFVLWEGHLAIKSGI